METTDTQPGQPPAPRRVLVGRYELGALIGRGGMAEVHAAWDTRLGREVAVKVLRSDLARDAGFLQRFRREAKSAAGLNHPGIVAVYDSGEDTSTELGGATLPVPFIVMELVHGKTLRDILHGRGGPLEPAEACGLIAQTLRALAYSHANGLIHRDIKPANVMVTDDGVVKLTDFGIARAIADSAATMTSTAVVVGTAQYLSPEQAQGKNTDARSDVYAAGCVLYELLTGRPPFTGDSPLVIAYQHVGEAPDPPSTHVSDLPRDIDAVILHALEKDPDDRYTGADAFADDLETVAAGGRPSEAALASMAAVDGGADAIAARAAGVDEGEDRQGVVPADHDDATSTFPPVGAVRRSRRRLLALAGALTLLLLVGLGVLASQGRIGAVGGVTVPDVRNKPVQDALDQLSHLGLTADVKTVSNRAPKDVVVRQNPDGGQQAPSGSRVQLEVSSGPENVVVPALSDYQLSTAQSLLAEKGLTAAIQRVDSYEFGKDTVIDTDPKAGTAAAQGSTVTLLVSNGTVKVPDMTGKTEAEVREQFLKYTFKVAITYVDDGGTPGTVVKQDFVGQSVPQGTEVRVWIVRDQPTAAPTVTRTVTLAPAPVPTATRPAPTSSAPAPTTTQAPSPAPTTTQAPAPAPAPTTTP